MKNNTAILLKKEKLIVFKFRDETFCVDLTEGDLDDNWNSILHIGKGVTPNTIYDTNFYWEDYPRAIPNLCLYGVHPNDEGEMVVDTSEEYPIKIVRQYGAKKEYFK
jgi:hypothetical protein